MIICIDVGNTNIKYAIFDGDALKFSREGSFPPSCLPSITPSSTCSRCI